MKGPKCDVCPTKGRQAGGRSGGGVPERYPQPSEGTDEGLHGASSGSSEVGQSCRTYGRDDDHSGECSEEARVGGARDGRGVAAARRAGQTAGRLMEKGEELPRKWSGMAFGDGESATSGVLTASLQVTPVPVLPHHCH